MSRTRANGELTNTEKDQVTVSNGNCWDNAPMESFYKTLKAEEVNRHHFRTKQEVKLVIFEYIEV